MFFSFEALSVTFKVVQLELDEDPSTVTSLLLWLTRDKRFVINELNHKGLLVVADKYDFPLLMEECASYISKCPKNRALDNFVLVDRHLHGNKELMIGLARDAAFTVLTNEKVAVAEVVELIANELSVGGRTLLVQGIVDTYKNQWKQVDKLLRANISQGIYGGNCPLCSVYYRGSDALVEHMKECMRKE